MKSMHLDPKPYLTKLILRLIFLLLVSCIPYSSFTQDTVLDSNMYHLRWGVNREWLEFPEKATDSRLKVQFNYHVNREYCAISLRQYDISRAWQVILNAFRLGTLTLDEKDMFTYFNVPHGYLKEGKNELIIESAEPVDPNNKVSDDIRVGQIVISDRPLRNILNESVVDVEVIDGSSRQLIPSKINIVNLNGTLQQAGVETGDTITARTGIIYTGTGRISFGLPVGTYKIYAARGFEYGVDSAIITAQRGKRVQKKLVINKEVNTDGWISCDPHVHTFTYSGHGDATVAERVLTIAGEGLEFPIITDHNVAVDIGPLANKMRLSSFFTPVVGNELTTRVGHFNIFPLAPGTSGTDYGATDWAAVSKSIHGTPGVKAIILNHPRDIHQGFRPFGSKDHVGIAGMDIREWEFPANAMEIMNSGSQQTNPRQLFFDWFGMLNRGYILTPVGSSDSHDVGRYIVGQSRTYIRATGNPAKIDSNALIQNFVNGKVNVSFGLITEIDVNNSFGPGDLVPAPDKIVVSVRVLGPGWVSANRVILYANGQKIRESVIPKGNQAGIKWKGIWTLPKSSHDMFLVAVAEGPGSLAPFWPIAKPYQHESPEVNPIVIGVSGAVWIDNDKDGKKTSAYHYANDLWNSSKGDPLVFLQRLSGYDESVAIQGAAILKENGVDIKRTDLAHALKKVSPNTRTAIELFIKEVESSQRAK